MLGKGYHSPCPSDVQNISNWPATQIYKELAKKCFTLEVEERSSFAALVQFIELKLSVDELKKYDDVANQYLRKHNLLLDRDTRQRLLSVGKRSSLPN